MIRKAAAALVGALLLSGCGAEVNAGVAARIGDHVIATRDLAELVDRSLSNPFYENQVDRRAEQTGKLTLLMQAHLVDVAADRLGVDLPQPEVIAEQARRIEAAGGRESYFRGLAREQGLHERDALTRLRFEMLLPLVEDALTEDIAVSEERLRKEYERQLPRFDFARVAHILMSDRRRAEVVARRAKEPGADFAALARRYSVDAATRDRGGVLENLVRNGEGRFEDEFEDAVFEATPGQVVGPVRTVSDDKAKLVGYEIFTVLARSTTPYADARLLLRREMLAQQRGERISDYVRSLAAELGIRVNPRFGRWDDDQIVVVPVDAAGLSSPAPDPALPNPLPQPGPGQPPAPTAPATPTGQQPTGVARGSGAPTASPAP